MKQMTVALVLVVLAGSVWPQESARAGTPVYSRDIAPLFAMKCNGCHGAPSIGYGPKPEGGLDTTNYRSLLRGGERGPGVSTGATQPSSVMMNLHDLLAPKFESKHPEWSSEETNRLQDWIRAGAPFDSEPVPNQCVDIESVATSRLYGTSEYPTDVYFRAWAPGYVSIRISRPSGDVIRTYSNALDWGVYRRLSTWEDFILAKQDGLPSSVDLRLCRMCCNFG